jgi:hypothetical protein
MLSIRSGHSVDVLGVLWAMGKSRAAPPPGLRASQADAGRKHGKVKHRRSPRARNPAANGSLSATGGDYLSAIRECSRSWSDAFKVLFLAKFQERDAEVLALLLLIRAHLLMSLGKFRASRLIGMLRDLHQFLEVDLLSLSIASQPGRLSCSVQ